MASTVTIQQTVNWCYAYTLGRPLASVAGITNEPALTAANLVLQTCLAPPLRWPWNRVSQSVPLATGVSDYPTTTTSPYGWLEYATISGGNLTIPTQQIEVDSSLAADARVGQPSWVSPAIESSNGQITFRFSPAPDSTYTAALTYQGAPALLTSLTSTWAPIPDRYQFIYSFGLLGMLQATYDLQHSNFSLSLFLRSLAAANDGLKAQDREIFVTDRLRFLTTQAQAMNEIPGGVNPQTQQRRR